MRGVDDVLLASGELRQVECVTIESHDAWIALAGFEALNTAPFEYEERAVVVFDDLALLGEICGMLVGVAPIIDEYADKKTIRPSVRNVEGEVAAHRSEATGLHDVGENVGAHLRRPVAQFTQAARRDIGGDGGDQERDHEGSGEEWPQQSPRRHAGRIHHDDLGVRPELVEDVRNCHQ